MVPRIATFVFVPLVAAGLALLLLGGCQQGPALGTDGATARDLDADIPQAQDLTGAPDLPVLADKGPAEKKDLPKYDLTPPDTGPPPPFQVVWDKVVLSTGPGVDGRAMSYENGQKLCFMGPINFYCFSVDGQLLVQEPLPGYKGNLYCCGGIVRGDNSYGTFESLKSQQLLFLTVPLSGKITDTSNAVSLNNEGFWEAAWDTSAKIYRIFCMNTNSLSEKEIFSWSFNEAGKLLFGPQLSHTPKYQLSQLINHIWIGNTLLLAGWGPKYPKGTPLPYSAAATTWGYLLEAPYAKVSKVVDLAPFGYHTGGAGVYPEYAQSRLATDGQVVFFGWTNFDLLGKGSTVAGLWSLSGAKVPLPAVITAPNGLVSVYPRDAVYHKGHFFLLLKTSGGVPYPGLYLVGFDKNLKEVFPITHLPTAKPATDVGGYPRMVALTDDLLIIYDVPAGAASYPTHFMRVSIKGLP